MNKVVRKGYFIFICILLCLLIPANSASAAKKVKMNKTKVVLYVKETLKLKVNGAKGKVKWSSNKKSVASVSSKGVVKAKKKGSAKITARVGKKKYACTVTVTSPYLSDMSRTLYVGDKTYLTLNGAKSKQVVNWNSYNESVAKISGDGVLEAVGAGETYVEADLYDVDIILKCKITVMANQSPSPQPDLNTPVVETPRPTITDHCSTFANYLMTSGKQDSKGKYYKDYYLLRDDYDTYSIIQYNPSSAALEYNILLENKSTSNKMFLYLEVSLTNADRGKLVFEYVPEGSTKYYMGSKSIVLSSITQDNPAISFEDYYNIPDDSIIEPFNKLAGTTLNLGMTTWKSIVESTGLSLHMNDLGFVSYQ